MGAPHRADEVRIDQGVPGTGIGGARSAYYGDPAMTSGLKGFIIGIATVACTLFVGFGGGVWVADWLNDTPPKLTRV